MFITFEGIEGCGKTTQIERLEKRLLNLGVTLIKTLEPGGTRAGKKIRQMLLDSRNNERTDRKWTDENLIFGWGSF